MQLSLCLALGSLALTVHIEFDEFGLKQPTSGHSTVVGSTEFTQMI